MYGRFADAKAPRGGAYSGLVLDYVNCKLTRALFNVRFQTYHSKLYIQLNICLFRRRYALGVCYKIVDKNLKKIY